jgi:hypothetical protein
MSLPVRLFPGQASIYGTSSLNNLLTNNMQFGSKAKVNDAVNFAMNMGIDKITQDKLGLTEILNTLNFSK